MKDWVICKIDVTVTRQGFSDTKTSKHLGKMSERTLWFPGQRYSSRERERVNWVFCLARASLLGSVSFTALLWIRHCCPLNVTSSTAQWIWQHKTFTLEHCDVASRQWIRQCCPLNVTSIQLSEFDKTKPVPLGAVHCDVQVEGEDYIAVSWVKHYSLLPAFCTNFLDININITHVHCTEDVG